MCMEKKLYERPAIRAFQVNPVSMMQSTTTGGGGNLPPGQDGEPFGNSRRLQLVDEEEWDAEFLDELWRM